MLRNKMASTQIDHVQTIYSKFTILRNRKIMGKSTLGTYLERENNI
jgi:hypothetical protein